MSRRTVADVTQQQQPVAKIRLVRREARLRAASAGFARSALQRACASTRSRCARGPRHQIENASTG